MVWSFLVICFESNAYRNIIKCVETAWTYNFFFLAKFLKKTGRGQLRVDVGIDQLPKWRGGTTLHSRKEGVCMHRNQAKLPLWQKVSKLFSMSFVCSWEWIKFLERPCEEWPAGNFRVSNGSIIWGSAFLSAIWTGFKSTKHFLILCFPSSRPPFLSVPLKSWGTVIFNCTFKTELSTLFLNLAQWL